MAHVLSVTEVTSPWRVYKAWFRAATAYNNVFNDFLWWPAFIGLLLTAWRERRAGRMRL